MKVDRVQVDCSFCKWYPLFHKNSLDAVTLPLPENVCKYLEHDAFLLPVEATSNGIASGAEWSDGSAVKDEDEDEVGFIRLWLDVFLVVVDSVFIFEKYLTFFIVYCD